MFGNYDESVLISTAQTIGIRETIGPIQSPVILSFFKRCQYRRYPRERLSKVVQWVKNVQPSK